MILLDENMKILFLDEYKINIRPLTKVDYCIPLFNEIPRNVTLKTCDYEFF